MSWEYKLVKFDAARGFFSAAGDIDSEKATLELNELGAQGWEMCATFETNVVQGRTAHVTFVMKRPVR
jgi:hypothetical protein